MSTEFRLTSYSVSLKDFLLSFEVIVITIKGFKNIFNLVERTVIYNKYELYIWLALP